MEACWLVAIVGLACSAGWAQPGDRNSIDIMVRLAGQEQWADEVDALPGQTVEVGVVYFRDRGFMFAGSHHNVIATNWDTFGGDTAVIVDNPNSTFHPDGRLDVWNTGGQWQEIYTTGIDLGRMRISHFGNPNNVPAGGIHVNQRPPTTSPPHIYVDGALGYRFNITLGQDAGFGRVIPLDAPEEDMASYSVYSTPGSTSATNILSEYDGTDGASIHVVPAPSAAYVLVMGIALGGRRR